MCSLALLLGPGSALAQVPDAEWTPRGPAPARFAGWSFGPVSGRVTALAKDGNGALYAGSTAGGLWVSGDDGATWTPLLDQAGSLAVGAIALGPGSPPVLWVGTGDNSSACATSTGIGLLRSTDGGGSWQPRNGSGTNAINVSGIAAILVDPADPDRVLVGGGGCATSANAGYDGIHLSTDGGASWLRVVSDTITDIVRDPQRPQVLWAGAGHGVYKSTDRGTTWTHIDALPGIDLTGRVEIAVSPADSNYVYVLFARSSGYTPALWRTTDGGTTWNQVSYGSAACEGACTRNMVLRAHPTDRNTVLRGTQRLWRSTDGGATWTDLIGAWGPAQKVRQGIHALLVESATTWYVGTDGGVWTTTDGGATFANRNGNLSITLLRDVGIHPLSDDILVAGSADNGALVRELGDTWDVADPTLSMVAPDAGVGLIDPLDPQRVFVGLPPASRPMLYRSTAGLHGPFSLVTAAGSGIGSTDRTLDPTPFALDPAQSLRLFVGSQRVYRSDDGGTAWTAIGPDTMGWYLQALEVNRGNGQYLWTGTDTGRVWRSTDGGANWSEVTNSGLVGGRPVTDIAGDPRNPERALVAVGGTGAAHLFRVSGTSWSEVGSGLPAGPVHTVVFTTESHVYAGTDKGVYRSTDGGASFIPFVNDLPRGLAVRDLEFNVTTKTLTAATWGRGVWQIPVPTRPSLRFRSVELPLQQVRGDGDASVEPGETWSFRTSLWNEGEGTATAVTATIVARDPRVVVTGATATYGTMPPFSWAAAEAVTTFTVDPAFPCGEAIVFDLVGLSSAEAPLRYADEPGILTVSVIDAAASAITLFDDEFGATPSADWAHAVQPGTCAYPAADEWTLVQKTGGSGFSWYAGNPATRTYTMNANGLLLLRGRDGAGPGLAIPAGVASARLTLRHWYRTESGWDGGQVLVDDTANGIDDSRLLVPSPDYPVALTAMPCAGRPIGSDAFSGYSGGWITSTFDLTPFAGRTIWLAFRMTGDDSVQDEGWYIDRVTVEASARICDVRAPGLVPGNATFTFSGGQVHAAWSPACNAAAIPGQAYALQRGDLDALRAGSYTHAPVEGRCDRVSPAAFTPGPGNEYYLVNAVFEGWQGGAGAASNGTARPLPDATCGTPVEVACP